MKISDDILGNFNKRNIWTKNKSKQISLYYVNYANSEEIIEASVPNFPQNS